MWPYSPADDEALAPGGYYYLKSGMLTQLKDDGIDLIIDSFKRMPNWYLMFFEHCGGAYRNVAPAATAFPNRDMAFHTCRTSGIWPNNDGIEENTAKMRANWKRTGAADQGFLHELRGSGRHDGQESRQLRRQLRAACHPQGQVRSEEPVSAKRQHPAKARLTLSALCRQGPRLRWHQRARQDSNLQPRDYEKRPQAPAPNPAQPQALILWRSAPPRVGRGLRPVGWGWLQFGCEAPLLSSFGTWMLRFLLWLVLCGGPAGVRTWSQAYGQPRLSRCANQRSIHLDAGHEGRRRRIEMSET